MNGKTRKPRQRPRVRQATLPPEQIDAPTNGDWSSMERRARASLRAANKRDGLV